MSDARPPMDETRYERAASYAPAVFAPNMAGVCEGYWVDRHRFFFCVRQRGASGDLLPVPKLFHTETKQCAALIEMEDLARLLSSGSDADLSVADLAAAEITMLDTDKLMIQLGMTIFHAALDGPALIRTEPFDPTPMLYAPDRSSAAFLRGHAVWIKDLETGAEQQITPDGAIYKAYGAAPESGIAPLAGRKMPVPHGEWSADSQWFVTHVIDESAMLEGGLTEHVPHGGGRAAVHSYKVSAPDGPLPTLQYLAWNRISGAVTTSDRSFAVHLMSPFTFGHAWLQDDMLYVVDAERCAADTALVAMELMTGKTRVILRETAERGWIDVHPAVNGHPLVRPVQSTNELIWWSQKDGRGHLYLHDLASGQMKNQITSGDWMVREIVHVDAEARRVLFLASGFDDAADLGHRGLFEVGFDGDGLRRLVDDPADLAVRPDVSSIGAQMLRFRPRASSGISPDGRFVTAQLGAIDQPTRTVVIEVATGDSWELAAIELAGLWQAPLPKPFNVLAADGKTQLHGAMYVPSDFDPGRSYPLVDYIYPGPQINWLTRRFPSVNALTAQCFAELGMVTIVLETRGMPNRDRAFHQAGQGAMLEPQLGDHVAAIRQLCDRHPFLDAARVGLFGQSGGGHATARAMFDYPETFSAGIAVCGNHDNRNYISLWLDKYCGPPGSPEREEQSNVGAAHKLRGNLFLIHGDMDDNVHPAHTLAVSAALIAANKDFDQLIVPGATHAIMMENPYVLRRMWDYFVRHLLGAEPPRGFELRWTPQGFVAALKMMMADQS